MTKQPGCWGGRSTNFDGTCTGPEAGDETTEYYARVRASQATVIPIADGHIAACDPRRKNRRIGMARASLMIAIGKLAIAGEQAGFTIEQMIDLLNSGLSVETLLELIARRLEGSQSVLPLINSNPNEPRRLMK